MKERWLILTGSYGNGHNAARDALAEVLKEQGHDVRSADMLDVYKNKGAISAKKFYDISSQKMPALWDRAFHLMDTKVANKILDFALKTLSHKDFDKMLDIYQPHYVVCVFPHWPVFLRDYIKKNGKKFQSAVMVTDAGHAGMPWYYGAGAIDHFFTIDDATKDFLEKKLRGKSPVTTSFFPLPQKYFLKKDGNPSGTIAMLLTGIDASFAETFIRSAIDVPEIQRLVVIQGRNQKLFQKLRKIKAKNVEFHEWWNIRDHLKDVDIFVAKPGGALACECIAQDVPMIIPMFTPGQEEGNVDMLENYGVGIHEPDPLRAVILARFLDVRKMIPNFTRLKKEGSAECIIDTLRNI